MSNASQQRGFAVALLLWMIAGMSLTVAAVIHFARADTSMAELRVREAKVQAMGRGVAHLLMRDSALAAYSAEAATTESGAQQGLDESERVGQKLFTKSYQFGEDWVISGTLRPSSGFVSLNNADRTELMMLFTGLGKVSERDAMAMADGVLAYRAEFPGFRYPEEMLAVPDASRVVYDNVKAYVHTYRTGALAAGSAPTQLAALATASGDGAAQDVSASGNGGSAPASGSGRGRIEGRITFESIAEAIRNPNGAADLAISAAELEVSLPGEVKLEQTVWVSGAGQPDVLRSGPVKVKKAERGNR